MHLWCLGKNIGKVNIDIKSIEIKDNSVNADIKTFPAHIGFRATSHRIAIYTFILMLVSVAPAFIGSVTEGYSTGIYLLGGAFFIYSLVGYFHHENSQEFRQWARKYFYGSLIYLPITFTLMLYFRNGLN
jgi:protoheme IX farnesyltransferase